MQENKDQQAKSTPIEGGDSSGKIEQPSVKKEDIITAFEKVFTPDAINDYLRKYTANERVERKEKLSSNLMSFASALKEKAQNGELNLQNDEEVKSALCDLLESKRLGRLVKIIKGEEVGLVDEDFIHDIEDAGLEKKDSSTKEQHSNESGTNEKNEDIKDSTEKPKAIDSNQEFFDKNKINPDKVYVNKSDGRQMKVVGFENGKAQIVFLPAGTKADEKGVNVINLDSDWVEGLDDKQIEGSKFDDFMADYQEAGAGELEIGDKELRGSSTTKKVDSMEVEKLEKGKGEVIGLNGLTDLFGVTESKYSSADGKDQLEITGYYYRKDDTEWDIKIKESADAKPRKVSPEELTALLAEKYTEREISPQVEEVMNKGDFDFFRDEFGRNKEFVYKSAETGNSFMIVKHKFSKQRKQNQVKILLTDKKIGDNPISFWVLTRGVGELAKKDESGKYVRRPAGDPEPKEAPKDTTAQEDAVEKVDQGEEQAASPKDATTQDKIDKLDEQLDGAKNKGPVFDSVKAEKESLEGEKNDLVDKGEGTPEKKETGSKLESEQEEGKQQAMDKKFETWKEAQVNVEEKGNKLNIVKRNLAKLGISMGEDAEAMKELKEAREAMKVAESEFKASHGDFSQETTERRKVALEKSKYKKKEKKELMREFMHKEKVVDSERIGEDGEKISEKISLMQDLNNKMLEMNKARMEALSKREKGVVGKLFEGYTKLSKKKKIAIGVMLAGTIGATGALAGGAAVGTAAGVAASTGTMRLVRSLIGGAVSAKVFKSRVDKAAQTRGVREENIERSAMGKYLKGKDMDMVSMVQKRMKLEKKDNIKAMAAAGITGFAVGGGVKAFTDLELFDAASFETDAPAAVDDRPLTEKLMSKIGVDYDSDNGNARFVGSEPEKEALGETKEQPKLTKEEPVDTKEAEHKTKDHVDGVDAKDSEHTKDYIDKEETRSDKSFTESMAKMKLADEIAEKMGIEFDPEQGKASFEGNVPTEINGQEVSMEILTEDQQKSVLSAREMRAMSDDYALSRDDAERIADFRLADSQKIMVSAADIAKKMGIEFDPEKTVVMQESGVPTTIGDKEVPMELLTEKQQGSVKFSREMGDLAEKVSLERKLPEFGKVSENQVSHQESPEENLSKEGEIGSQEKSEENLEVETKILTSKELSQKLEGLKINEKDSAWKALSGMTLKELESFPKTQSAAVDAWKAGTLNLPEDARAILGFVDIREAGRMGKMASIIVSEIDDTKIDSLEGVTLENALRGDFVSTKELIQPEDLPMEEMSVELKKGENVWQKVSEHYDGEQDKTAKVIVAFEEKTVKELQRSGMSEQKAKDFIDWKFRHLPVGQDVELDESGLRVEGFTDKKGIRQFEAKYEAQSVEPKPEAILEPKELSERELAEKEYNEMPPEQRVHEDSSLKIEEINAVANDELMNAGLEINSKTWNLVKGISVEKLLKEIPADDRDPAIIYKELTKPGHLIQIDELKQDGFLDGVSYKEFKDLQKISNMMNEWTPDKAEMAMSLEDYLESHVEQSLADVHGEDAGNIVQEVVSPQEEIDSVGSDLFEKMSYHERIVLAETSGKDFLSSVKVAAEEVQKSPKTATQFYQENRLGIEIADKIHDKGGFEKGNIEDSVKEYIEKGNTVTEEELKGLAKLIENAKKINRN